jgi:peptide/nickel transport system permease protein
MKRNPFQAALHSPRALSGLLLILVVLFLAIFAPYIVQHPPAKQDLLARLKPPMWIEAGSAKHILGTDHLGRDLFSRIVYGTRISLSVSLAAVFLAALLGISLGLLAGYGGGRLDFAIMRLVDIQLSFPVLLLAIILMAVLRPSIPTVIFVLMISGWATYARVVRAQVLSLREREFVQAARALGSSPLRIVVKHIVPNLFTVIIVLATIQTAQFILAESALSFLGLGILPPTPSWGGMINEGRGYVWSAWWIQTFPGIAIVLAVSGIGLFGDWLRDYLDPYQKR